MLIDYLLSPGDYFFISTSLGGFELATFYFMINTLIQGAKKMLIFTIFFSYFQSIFEITWGNFDV